ncbi:T9SS C-terminal target domain-containing protein [Kordia zhangzhouensis]|uniref:T9SS C-terminal target domain-containing protein n=1 Tax=Kordia zhangzhouensis TaxID=1620405 RepID=UPI0006291539|nr:T9SS C-terminal target domain-containing protein [Kordia zhangzhouensis]
MKQLYLPILLLFSLYTGWSQTTDLSTSIEVTNLNGTPISNVVLFEEFYYTVTISNSGNAVSNATFLQQLNANVEALSVESINAVGGANLATSLTYNANTAIVTATLPNMPNASSVQIRILARAPKFSGGISTTATVTPPNGTTDSTPNNNTSIVSMDVTYVPLDFSVTYQQVNPVSGTGISAWGDQVTFEFTITNNSSVQYPLDSFLLFQGLQSNSVNGSATLQLLSLECLGSTNGVLCPTDFGVLPGNPTMIVPIQQVYGIPEEIIFPSQGSLSFRVVFEYTEGDCGIDSDLIIIQSFVQLVLAENNTNSNQSNIEITDLLFSTECPCTDVSIATEQIDPMPGPVLSDFNQQVTYQTTLVNNGPLDTSIQFFMQNLGIPWEFVSITCISTTGGITCADLTFDIQEQFWQIENFQIPVGTVIVIETIVDYTEPVCPTDGIIDSPYRTTANVLQHIDCDLGNNNDFDTILLPQATGTNDCITPDNVSITKTQVSPSLPIGGSDTNPMPWGDVTYHITVANNNTNDIPLTLIDFYGGTSTATGVLQSVTCIQTTGTADCYNITNANIGSELTQIDEVFWEITEAENWILPTQSTITFEVVVNWNPQCSDLVVPVENAASVSIVGLANSTQTASEVSYLTSCVDLIIQTYPSQATIPINSNFNWIVDITNSIVSSTATNAFFSTNVNSAFTITGAPTCTITNGNATCIPSFSIDNTTNEVSGFIPILEPDATIQIIIPVSSPSFGGSFNNIAEVQPDPANNSEADPSTNISISSAQVLSPSVTKNFTPNEIFTSETSLLTFTIQNTPGNAAQSGISFTDNLPSGIVLASSPTWVQSNGCTADFVGLANDDFVGIANLVFPDGVANCSFSVLVTSNSPNFYTNEFSNFSNLNNIDATSTFATLNVLPIPPSADLEISMTPNQTQYCEGDEAIFTLTITNNGPDDVTAVAIESNLSVSGFTFISDDVGGTYSNVSGIWELSGISISSNAGNNTFTATIITTILDIDSSIANQFEVTAEITATSTIDLDSDVNTSFDVDDLGDGITDDDEIQLQLSVFEVHDNINITVSNTETCIGSTTILTIDNPITNYTYNWYDTSNPTQPIFTGTAYETPVILANTVYEIEVLNENNCPGIAREMVSVTAISCVDLGIEKEVDTQTPSINETIQFTITITNYSNTEATNIIVEELLPNGYEYNSHNASIGLYNNTSQVWTISSLPAGSSATLTLHVIVVDSDDYTNIVQITNLSETDLNIANNSANATTFPDCLEIPSGFSPNNDHINDVWEINCLENYNDNELIIFNRWGTVVYQTKNYANDWNGRSNQNLVLLGNNERLPIGTYFYILKLQENTIKKTGWIYLNY